MVGVIIATLALYGVCSLLTEYSGPFDTFSRLREQFRIFRCVACLAVWLGIPIAYLSGIGFLGYLAIIGGVLIMDRNLNL